MKTNLSFRIFKPSTLVSLGIAIAAALVTQPVRAIPIQTLVITETSSTSLTALLNGTSFLNVFPNPSATDDWTITLAGVGNTHGLTSFTTAWVEPDSAGFVNIVTAFLGELTVTSEILHDTGLANGATDKTDFTLDGVELDVTFNDKGDVAAAPDTGSTFGLLSLSVVALLGATRLRFLFN